MSSVPRFMETATKLSRVSHLIVSGFLIAYPSFVCSCGLDWTLFLGGEVKRRPSWFPLSMLWPFGQSFPLPVRWTGESGSHLAPMSGVFGSFVPNKYPGFYVPIVTEKVPCQHVMVNFHFWVWAVSYLCTGDRPDVVHSHPVLGVKQ